MIRFNCPHCGKNIGARDESAGKPGKCPGCGQASIVPATTPVPMEPQAKSADRKLRPSSTSNNSTRSWIVKMVGLAIALLGLIPVLAGYEGDVVAIWSFPCLVVGVLVWAFANVLSLRTTERSAEKAPVESSEPRSVTGIWKAIGAVAGGSVLLCCGFFMSSDDEFEPDKGMAWIVAEDFVKRGLKSPSTADFGGRSQDPDDCVTELGNEEYRVRGWVDSQNAFGATIRMNFVCEVRYVGDEEWECSKRVVFTPR